MKYKYGKQYFDKKSNKTVYVPRIYTDFYCSIDEWTNLGKGKSNFMYQLRSKIVEDGLLNDYCNEQSYISKDGQHIYYVDDIERKINTNKIQQKIKHDDNINKILGFDPNELFCGVSNEELNEYITKNELTLLDKTMFIHKNGLRLYKLSLCRWGRRDNLNGEIYSANIIKHVIKYITHKDADVEFYSWKGTIDHVEISFGECEMPNIIVLIDSYTDSSTNRTLIHCIDAIYKTLKNKSSFYYDVYHKPYYNNNYDKIFNYSEECYNYNKEDYPWNDTYRMKKDRAYDCVTIYYK